MSFLWAAIAHFIALTSPGPDTAIVLRQTTMHGRWSGIKASIGIGFGIFFHSVLAISGFSLLILSNENLKFYVSVIGGAYIVYLSIIMLKDDPRPNENNFNRFFQNPFMAGFITNVLNIKAFLFFVSLFSVLIQNINILGLYLYPIYFSVTSALWFILLSFLVTTAKIKNINIISNKNISYVLSLVLLLIGLSVIFSGINDYF